MQTPLAMASLLTNSFSGAGGSVIVDILSYRGYTGDIQVALHRVTCNGFQRVYLQTLNLTTLPFMLKVR